MNFYPNRVKELFANYISVLDRYMQDPQVQLRRKALAIVHQLLRNKPEQEQRLLVLLVNKLGDPDRRLASNAMFYLNRLAVHHPMMTPFIVDEIGRFVFRPNLPLRAQYYALCFLNTLELPSTDAEVAESTTCVKMLQVYFMLFKSVYAMILDVEDNQQTNTKPVKKFKKPRTFRVRSTVADGSTTVDENGNIVLVKPNNASGELQAKNDHQEVSKLFSALLSGVNRAFAAVPASARKETIGKLLEHTDALFKLLHTCKSFPATMQILLLLQQLCTSDPSSGAEQSIDDSDEDENPLRNRFYAVLYRKLMEPEVLDHQSSRASKLLLNILYKSLANDSSAIRMRAMVKRTLQLALGVAPHFACALLVVIDAALKQHPQNTAVMRMTSKFLPKVDKNSNELSRANKVLNSLDDSDVEENYADIPDENDGPNQSVTEIDKELASKSQEPVSSSWVHSSNKKLKQQSNTEKTEVDDHKNAQKKPSLATRLHAPATAYDFFGRNPRYAGAEYETYWELLQLSHHAHPSVAIMAQKLLGGTRIEYSGNPMDDFTTIKFLDRFVGRNPKKTQKGAQHALTANRDDAAELPKHALDLTSGQYARLPQSQVPPDEQFLHTFAQLRAASKFAADQHSTKNVNDDIESVADDEFDNYLDRFERQRGDMYDKEAKLIAGDDDEDDEVLDEIDFSEAMKQAGLETLEFNDDVAAGEDDDKKAEFAVVDNGDGSDNDDAANSDDDLVSVDSDSDEPTEKNKSGGGDGNSRKRKRGKGAFNSKQASTAARTRGRRGGGRRKKH